MILQSFWSSVVACLFVCDDFSCRKTFEITLASFREVLRANTYIKITYENMCYFNDCVILHMETT